MSSLKSACVVGAGFAGLAAALELSRCGIRTTVVEAALQAGGRAQTHRSPDGRFRFDMGPTIITMTDVLRRALGDAAFESLALRRLEPGYRVCWPDGDYFDMHSDIGLWVAEVLRYRSDGAGAALDYLSSVYAQFLEAKSTVLDNAWTLKGALDVLKSAGRLQPWVVKSLRKRAERAFRHPRLVQAATFQTLYLGMTPSRSPAMYGLLMAHEVVDGVWYANGGTGAIVDSLVNECRARGVSFAFGTPVTDVALNRGRLTSVGTRNARFDVDGAIVTSDRETALHTLFNMREKRNLRYGHSAIVYAIGFDAELPFGHHTVLLPDDPWRSYERLDAGLFADDALVYLCNPSASEGVATRGAVTALVPVPNRSALATIDEQAVLRSLLRRIDLQFGDISRHVKYVHHRGPAEFQNELGLRFGAAFGPSHDLWQMGPFRPSLDCPVARNVSFAGAGTRPGSGVPLALMSGRLAAQRLLEKVA